jgi:hypothetical protein
MSAIYANRDVAFGWEAGLPEGAELQSARQDGDLPWFAKTGIFVRGKGTVVVQVPADQRDVVRISGWYGPGTDGELRTEVLVEPVPPVSISPRRSDSPRTSRMRRSPAACSSAADGHRRRERAALRGRLGERASRACAVVAR